MSYRIHTDDLMAMLHADSVAALVSQTARICQALEFEYFVYGSRQSDALLVISTFPMAWQQHYARENLIADDPTVVHAMTSCLPLVWSHELLATPSGARVCEDARGHGIGSGVTLPIRGSGRQRAIMNFASGRLLGPDHVAHARSVLAETLMVTSYFQESMQRLAVTPAPAAADIEPLTPREIECLRWAMAGKSSWETGQIITCSERTVNFHIGNVMRKLGVTNRRVAVVKALTLNLITP